MFKSTVFLLEAAAPKAPKELQMSNPQMGARMKTFTVGIKPNKSLHVEGTIMDITDEGHLIILHLDDVDEYVVAIFKDWECCMERSAVRGAFYVDQLDE